jgi:excisionase family DNA binding protein
MRKNTHLPSDAGLHPTQALAANPKKCAAGLLLETPQVAGELDQPVLSVAAVARQLSVSTATVYGLCASGKLPHVRILNALRVRSPDLREFIHRTSSRVAGRDGHRLKGRRPGRH